MKKLLLISVLLLSSPAYSADYTVEFQPADQSIGDQQVSSITSSKITDFISEVSSRISAVVANYVLKSDIKTPTIQTFLSVGTTTYTTPPGVKWIEVEMVGGGQGGGGAYAEGDSAALIQASFGSLGSDTSFGGTSFLLAEGGGRGGVNPDPVSKCVISSPAIKIKSYSGTAGGLPNYGGTWNYSSGGTGGSSALGGAGPSSGFNKGQPAIANSGSGGGGGGSNATASVYSGKGGYSGCYLVAQINNPASSYQVVVGAGGAGGSGSGPVSGGNKTNKFDGGAGASGIVIVREYYQ